MESVLRGLRPGLGIGLLADLPIAWAEGSLSEGAMADVTGIDPITLRGLKRDAIDRAPAFASPILEAKGTRTVLEVLDGFTPEDREKFLNSRPEFRSICELHSPGSPSTGPP